MAQAYGHALSILREVSMILSDQMAGVDLYGLRSDTLGGASTTTTALLDNNLAGINADVAVETRWYDVLTSVSTPLVMFHRELTSVQEALKKEQENVRRLRRMVWTIHAAAVAGLSLGIFKVLTPANLDVDVVGTLTLVAVLVGFELSTVALLRVWSASNRDQYARLHAEVVSPVHAVLQRYDKDLSSQQVVVLASAISRGEDVPKTMVAFDSFVKTQSELSGCATPEYNASTVLSAPGWNPCSDVTSATFPTWIRAHVPIKVLLLIVDALIDLKEYGVDRYDRAPLWLNVTAGVDAVRSLSLVEYDDGDPARTLTLASVEAAIDNEVVPILCVQGVELPPGSYEIKSTDMVTNVGGPARPLLVTLNPPDQSPPMSSAQCARAIMESGGEFSYGYFQDTSKVCLACRPERRGDVSSLTTLFDRKSPPLTGRDVLILPHVPRTPSSTTPYATALTTPWAVAGTIVDQSDDIRDRLMSVLRRYRFSIDIDAHRARIDRRLTEFYGPTYVSGGGSSAVDSVLSELREDVARELSVRRVGQTMPRFVDAARISAKMRALSGDGARSLKATLQSLTDSVRKHVDLYPGYESPMPAAIASVVSWFGGALLLTAYVTYLMITRGMLRSKALDDEAFVQRVVVATCVLTMTLFVFESVTSKMAVDTAQNYRIATDNSTLLVGATVRVNDDFDKLLGALSMTRSPWSPNNSDRNANASVYGTPVAAATAFLADCKGVVEKFEACNTVTSFRPTLPPPLTELLMYAVVTAGVVAFSAYCVSSISPTDRLRGVSHANALLDRVSDGDLAAITEARLMLSCTILGGGDIQKIATRFGLVLFVILTLWFAQHAYTALETYRAAVRAGNDCV